ncbi:MAG: riboflavin synthase [Oscillospiraceae bacterium]|nr:riboflavin synthase [Oscillospiraceae bacterium]
MFTGLIEETGTVIKLERGYNICRLSIKAEKIFSDLKTGDSVAVNGVCLTAESIDGNIFTADVMNETLRRSNLGKLSPGSPVNLERAMPANGRFGGHIVSGHIDETGRIVSVTRDDNAVIIRIAADNMRYITEKGSVALDGISLTVAEVTDRDFTVSVIPHTRKMTALRYKDKGSEVNIEFDIIGKYVERFAGKKEESRITLDYLKENGF